MEAAHQILAALDATDTALRLPDAQRDAILREGRWLAGLIESDGALAAREVIFGGSIPKGTALLTSDDLDLYPKFDLSHARWAARGRRRSPEAFLDTLDRRLQHLLRVPIHRQRVTLRRQAHSVRVDMLDGVAFDIVPLAWCPRGSAALELPERQTGRWIRTAMGRQRQLFGEAARRHPGLRGGIRLLKAWRDANGLADGPARWSSYALEVMALFVCCSRKAIRRPGEVFLAVLQWLADGGLDEPVVIRRWRGPRVSTGPGPTVRDPAWLENELMPRHKAQAAKALVEAAVGTLRALEQADTAGVVGGLFAPVVAQAVA